MPAGAFVLALTAAFLHAGWNVLLGRARDSEAAAAVAVAISVVLFAPAAALSGGVRDAAAPYVVASAVLHLVYLALLAAAYRGGEVSVVYPVARGSGPVLVLVGGAVALGAGASVGQAVGVALVAVGVVAVRGLGSAATASGRDLAFGLAVGVCIAGYTLVDKEGLRHAEPVAYLELVLAGPAAVYPLALALAGRGGALRAELRPVTALIGMMTFAAYALVLAALKLAPAASVAAVRESSVVIAVAMASAALSEPVGRLRLAGAALVVGGIAAVALG